MALNNLLHLVFSGDKLKLFQVSNGLSEYFTIFTEDCRIMNLTQHFVSITSNSISTKTSKMTYLQRQHDTYLYIISNMYALYLRSTYHSGICCERVPLLLLKFVALDIVFQIENWYSHCTTFFNKKQKRAKILENQFFTQVPPGV